VLKAAFVQGRLGKDEFDLRVGRAFAARTHAELAVGRVDVRVPRALAQGFRGRSPSRSRLAGLPDHPHLPVHSGHDPVAGRGSDGSVMAKAAFRRRTRWTTGPTWYPR
jgi:hypothetical protein